jgi:8-amino-7-oxononanoate synthase
MIDFTSALYLGMEHAGGAARWPSLTTGVPAALRVPDEVRDLEGSLGALFGTERCLVGPSTLHLFFDLILLMAKGRLVATQQDNPRAGRTPGSGVMSIHVDRAAYPIAHWGVERAAGAGLQMSAFRHHDPEALARQLRKCRVGVHPLVVVDGVCPGCGSAAPIPSLLEVTRAFGGALVVDDTQAIGILGVRPNAQVPLGCGGGGSLRWHGVGGGDVVVVSSLAKAFGVPLAALGGSARLIEGFEREGETRVYCSPPSLCHVHAAADALVRNRRTGDRLRGRLVSLVDRFQEAILRLGLSTSGGSLPVQTLQPIPGVDPVRLHESLLAHGVRSVLASSRCGRGARVTFLITAAHRPADIDRAADALAGALRAAA